MALLILIAGLLIFVGTHVFVTFREARAKLKERLGQAYRPLFALVSALGIVLVIYGYGTYRVQGIIPVWSPPAIMRHFTVALMLVSVVFLTAAFIPSHIKSRLKYPMLAAVKTWAFAHLLANGDLGSILLFGAFLGWAVYARIAAKRRGDPVPVSPRGWGNDIIVGLLGIVIFLALGFAFHPIVIGVPVFGS